MRTGVGDMRHDSSLVGGDAKRLQQGTHSARQVRHQYHQTLIISVESKEIHNRLVFFLQIESGPRPSQGQGCQMLRHLMTHRTAMAEKSTLRVLVRLCGKEKNNVCAHACGANMRAEKHECVRVCECACGGGKMY